MYKKKFTPLKLPIEPQPPYDEWAEKGTGCNKIDTGFPGQKGEKGDKGDKGDTGDIGPSGENGLQGERGLKGEQGQQGLQGIKGDTGDTGPQGLNCNKGDPYQIIIIPLPQNPIYPPLPTMFEDFENFMTNNTFITLFTEYFTTGW